MKRSQLMIPKGKIVAIDTETTGLDVWSGDRPFAIALCNADGKTGYCEWPVDPTTRVVDIHPGDVARLRDWLADPSITRVFHNAKFDLHMLKHGLDIEVAGLVHDTMIATFSCITSFESYGLKELASTLLGDDRSDVDELHHLTKSLRLKSRQCGWAIHPDSFQADFWLPRVWDSKDTLCRKYALQDVQNTFQLWQELQRGLGELDSWDIYEIELQLMFLVMRMEERGVRLDLEVNRQELDLNRTRAKKTLRQLRELTALEDFNPNSSQQVAHFLYENLELACPGLTAKGSPKTDQKTLAKFAHLPPVQLLIEHRTTSKAVNTFFEAFQGRAVADPLNPGGVCIHPTFRHIGQRTGRFSCSNPNLQAVSSDEGSRSENPISARKPFGPRPGYIWVTVDYSQVEARIFAEASGEPVLQAALASGRDFHSETANAIWGGRNNPRAIEAAKDALETHSDAAARRLLKQHDYDIVAAEASLGKKTSRSRAKSLVFSRIMGGGVNPIMEALGCSEAEARKHLRDLDKAIPGIRRFLRSSERIAPEEQSCKTLFGRRLHLPVKDYWKAGSYIVQGTAADLLKRQMLKCDQYFRRHQIDAHILLAIHDELIFEVHRSHFTGRLLKRIKRIMESGGDAIGIDLPVEINVISRHWSQKEKIDVSQLSNGRIIKCKGKYRTISVKQPQR